MLCCTVINISSFQCTYSPLNIQTDCLIRKNELKHTVSNDILASSTKVLREYVGVDVLGSNLELQEKFLRTELTILENNYVEVRDKITKDLKY